MEDGIPGRLQHHYKMCCEKGWLPWKAGLYDLGVVSLQECCFQTGGLVYSTAPSCDYRQTLLQESIFS